MRRTAFHLAQWGKLHRLNDHLDEHVLTKQTKPPAHSPKLEFSDWNRMQEFARHGKERFEPEEAPLEPFLRDSSARDMSHTEGLDSNVNLERFNPSRIARGLVMNRWLTPFQFKVVNYKMRMRLIPGGKATRITCMVIVGNGNGVAGLGWGRHNNFRAKGPVTTKAIQQAFRNLVAINPDPPRILHTIRVKWRHQKLVLKPCHRVIAPFWIREAAELFGLKGVRVQVISRFRKRRHKMRSKNGILHAFFLAMEKYHRSVSEIAAARGLVPQGNINGVKSYVEEVRAYKGMYTKSPPISNRDTAADRWKWNSHRHQVLQYPNPQLLQEILYGDVRLGAEAAAAVGAVPATVEALPAGPAAEKVAEATSGRPVGDPWENREKEVREQVAKDIENLREGRAKRRSKSISQVLGIHKELTSPEINEEVRNALHKAIYSPVMGSV